MKTFILLLPAFVCNYIFAQNSVGIGTVSPLATLDVLRGTAPWGTATLRGTTHNTHFNFGSTEDTYIRGGKAGSHVILNDLPGLGNVGIGTNNPIFPLTFSGALGDKISIWSDGTPTHYGMGIQSSLFQIFAKTNIDDIAFGYGSSTAFTERMRIKGNGNVGIGTSTPASTLDVNGQIKISGGSPGTDKILVSDASGIASWSNSSINTGAFAYSGGGTPQTILNGVNTVMSFPATYLAGNNYSASDNSYTCPTPGFYHFDMQLSFKTINGYSGDKQLNIGFYVNGSAIWNPPYLLRNTTIDNTYQFSFSTQCTAGDKISFHITQNTGVSQQLLAGYFQGYRVY